MKVIDKDIKNYDRAFIPDSEKAESRGYPRYVLFVLTLVSIVNFYDRAIMSVLIEDIKADLLLSDADLGFIGGAAFAIFYATFGMAIAKLADVWTRTRLISIGLGFWSVMTALSGLSQGIRSLALCRFGVGVGESCSTPSALSVIYDYFPSNLRTKAVAIFSCGAPVGGGLGIFLSALILDGWNSSWPDSTLAPLGLKGWQAAFILAGLPGVLLSIWVYTLKEPSRGRHDGLEQTAHQSPFHEFLTTLFSMVPIVNIWLFSWAGHLRKGAIVNIAILLTIVTITYFLISLTGDTLQWVSMAIGVYAAGSWAQSLCYRDSVVFFLIFRCKTTIFLFIGMMCLSLMLGAMFWNIPYLQRNFDVSASEVGEFLGGWGIATGLFGTLSGGFLADKLYSRYRRGKLYILLMGLLVCITCFFVLLTTEHLMYAYATSLLITMGFSMTIPSTASTLNDLMIPRGRATIVAFYIMIFTISGAALGPYVVGSVSDGLMSTGLGDGEALRQAMLWLICAPVVGVVFILLAIFNIEKDERTMVNKVVALGEIL